MIGDVQLQRRALRLRLQLAVGRATISGSLVANAGKFTSLSSSLTINCVGGINTAGALATSGTFAQGAYAGGPALTIGTLGALSSQGPLTSSQGLLAMRAVQGETCDDNYGFKASGTIYQDLGSGVVACEIGALAANFGIDAVPFMQMMGVDADGKLQEYKLQVSGGIFQVNVV